MDVDEKIAKEQANKIYKDTFKRKGLHQKAFYLGIKALKPLFWVSKLDHPSSRADFIFNYYFYMRMIDDIVDGDIDYFTKYNDDYSNFKACIDFVDSKIELANDMEKGIINPKDSTDHLLHYCNILADTFGENFYEGTSKILTSMRFDAVRRFNQVNTHKLDIYKNEDLMHHFHMLDVEGCIDSCIRIFDEPQTLYPKIECLGLSSRIYYDIRDIIEDIRAGLINIPIEDCLTFNVTESDLLQVSKLSKETADYCKVSNYKDPAIIKLLPNSIIDWLDSETDKGLSYINQYVQNIENTNIRPITQKTLNLAFMHSSKSYLDKIKS